MATAGGAPLLAAHQLARQLKTSVAPHPFKDSAWRWGTVVNTHLPIAPPGTLVHAANVGDKHILVKAPTAGDTPPITKGAFVEVASSNGSQIYQISAVANHSGTYRLVLGRLSNNGTRGLTVTAAQPAGASVYVLSTVDVQMNGAVGAGAGSTKNVHYGVRYLASYSPQVGDQVLVAHIQASDWTVIGPVASTAPTASSAPNGHAIINEGGTLSAGSTTNLVGYFTSGWAQGGVFYNTLYGWYTPGAGTYRFTASLAFGASLNPAPMLQLVRTINGVTQRRGTAGIVSYLGNTITVCTIDALIQVASNNDPYFLSVYCPSSSPIDFDGTTGWFDITGV